MTIRGPSTARRLRKKPSRRSSAEPPRLPRLWPPVSWDRLKAAPGKNVVVAFDGYATADWTRMVNLLSQQLIGKGIDVEAFPFAEVFKSEQEIADIIDPNLEWDTTKDPSLLFGRLIKRSFEDFFDTRKVAAFRSRLEGLKAPVEKGRVLIVFGSGCLVKELLGLYDVKCYFDVTPKESILRIRRGQYANMGDKVAVRPIW